jgi:hypothetical protein
LLDLDFGAVTSTLAQPSEPSHTKAPNQGNGIDDLLSLDFGTPTASQPSLNLSSIAAPSSPVRVTGAAGDPFTALSSMFKATPVGPPSKSEIISPQVPVAPVVSIPTTVNNSDLLGELSSPKSLDSPKIHEAKAKEAVIPDIGGINLMDETSAWSQSDSAPVKEISGTGSDNVAISSIAPTSPIPAVLFTTFLYPSVAEGLKVEVLDFQFCLLC